MRNLKKFLSVLLVIVLLAVPCSMVFAEDTISADAKICADLGMLLGDGSGVTVEYTAKVPVRIQTAIMYLRLKGLYDEAKEFTGTDNFSDVANVYAEGKKILAYLKAHPELGFVGSNGKFGPDDPTTAQQYYKVMLTALGYVQDLDFKWGEVFTFAASVGLTKLTADTNFTVDSLAIATVETLGAAVYGGNDTLAGQLVIAGILDPQKVADAGLKTSVIVPVAIDSTASYMSFGENYGWQNHIYTLGENTSGKQYASFDVTPLIEKVDGSVDFADSEKEVSGFADLAMLIRFNADGFVDVRNGPSFEKLADVPYSANLKYHVEVYADMVAKKYTVYVTPPEGQRTKIAEDYAFRPSAEDTDDMGKVFFISADASDEMKVENVIRRALLDEKATYMSKGENMGWQSYGVFLGSNNKGKVQVNFDMTALHEAATIDGSCDFADSDKVVFGFSELSMLVRMCQGYFDVRNGLVNNSQMADVKVAIETNVVYHIEVQADMNAKTYSVWVTSDGGEKVQIAKDYGFRTSAADADDLGQMFFVSSDDNDWIKTENIVVKTIQ